MFGFLFAPILANNFFERKNSFTGNRQSIISVFGAADSGYCLIEDIF
jgi:hypothetical protein